MNIKTRIIKALLAGISISVAAIAYLSADSYLAGGVLFGLGLLSIYVFDWDLYTGKCCFLADNPKKYSPMVLSSFIGNILSVVLMGYLFRLTGVVAIENAEHAVEVKLAYELYQAFVLAIFCGIMMCIAVKGYQTQKTEIGKIFIVILPVTIFILSKFEHSIANLFYFSLANAWSGQSVVYILVCAVGNLIGCSLIPVLCKFIKVDDSHDDTHATSDNASQSQITK